MKRLLLALSLALLLSPLAVAQTNEETFEGKTASIRVGENHTVNTTVVNPLPIPDNLEVNFRGEAIESGLVTVFYEEPTDVTCRRSNNRCIIPMGPDGSERGERDVRLRLEGTAIGQGPIIANVSSTTTQLSSRDRMDVRVKPYFAPVTVSAPGMQGLQIAVLALLSALLAGYFFRKNES